MLRAARVARGSHPATPASARPAPGRVPSPTARLPAVVLRAAPSSLGPLSVTTAGRNGGAAQLALPTLSAHSAERALYGRESPSDLAPLLRGFSAVPTRRNGAQWPLLFGASVSLALRPRAPLAPLPGDGSSRSRSLQRRGFSSSDSAEGNATYKSTVPPASTPALAPPRDFRVIKSLPFVDRDNEAFEIAWRTIQNVWMARTGDDRKVTLVTAGQLYGAGKTLMGRNAVARVAAETTAGAALRGRITAALMATTGLSEQETRDLVNEYANAVTVFIDLKNVVVSGAQNLERLLIRELRKRLGDCAEIKDKDAWDRLTADGANRFADGADRFAQIVDTFKQQTGRNVFIHIDEVGVLAGSKYAHFFKTVPSDTRHVAQVRRFYDFWEEIEPLLKLRHAYLFVSGKQAAFALLGLGLYRESDIGSHTDHYALVLGALSAKDIQESYEKGTLASGEPLARYVRTKSLALLPELCKAIQQATSGLPRLVHYCLQALCQIQPGVLVLHSLRDIDAALLAARGICWDSSLLRRVLAPVERLSEELQPAYYELLVAALLGEPLLSSELLHLAGGELLPMAALIDMTGLYAVSAGVYHAPDGSAQHLLRVYYPPWAAQYVRQHPVLQRDVRLATLLPLWNTPVEALDHGAPLEWALRVRVAYLLQHFVLMLRMKATWADVFPVLADTLIAKEIVMLAVDGKVVRALPQVESVHESAKRVSQVAWDKLEHDPWAVSVTKKDWAELLAKPWLLAPGVIGYFAAHSYGPDLAVRSSKSTVVAFQGKLGTTEIAPARLQEEIDKTAALLGKIPEADVTVAKQKKEAAKETGKRISDALDVYVNARQGTDGWYTLTQTACQRLCLVVAAWELSPTIAKAMGDKQKLVLDAGISHFGNSSSSVSVPEGMQVVLLSRAGIEALLGESFSLLDELVKRRGNAALASRPLALQRLGELFTLRNVRLPPSELESFLRNEAKIDADGVNEYVPLLLKNKADEAGLRVLATKSEEVIKATLKEMGINAVSDRIKLAEAIVTRFGGGGGSRK